jgi:hypothetical protein
VELSKNLNILPSSESPYDSDSEYEDWRVNLLSSVVAASNCVMLSGVKWDHTCFLLLCYDG